MTQGRVMKMQSDLFSYTPKAQPKQDEGGHGWTEEQESYLNYWFRVDAYDNIRINGAVCEPGSYFQPLPDDLFMAVMTLLDECEKAGIKPQTALNLADIEMMVARDRLSGCVALTPAVL